MEGGNQRREICWKSGPQAIMLSVLWAIKTHYRPVPRHPAPVHATSKLEARYTLISQVHGWEVHRTIRTDRLTIGRK